jgi:hypothetical protein
MPCLQGAPGRRSYGRAVSACTGGIECPELLVLHGSPTGTTGSDSTGRKVGARGYAVTMTDSYTVFWSNHRCQRLERYGLGARLTVLFGGPHLSQPNFRRAGVHEGDYLHPVRVLGGSLYVLGRMRVRQLISLEHAEIGAKLDDYLQRYAQWRWLQHTCTMRWSSARTARRFAWTWWFRLTCWSD